MEEFTKENSKYKEDQSVIVAVLSHGAEERGKFFKDLSSPLTYYLSVLRDSINASTWRNQCKVPQDSHSCVGYIAKTAFSRSTPGSF